MSHKPPPVVQRSLRALTRLGSAALPGGGRTEHHVEVHNYSSMTVDVHVAGDCDVDGALRYLGAGSPTPAWRPPAKRLYKPTFLGNCEPVRFRETVGVVEAAGLRSGDATVRLAVFTTPSGPVAESTAQPDRHSDFVLQLRCG